MVKNLPANAGRRRGFNPWVRKIPWRRKWQPAPVFLPGEFHGRRSLVGYSPWGRKESDTTERLSDWALMQAACWWRWLIAVAQLVLFIRSFDNYSRVCLFLFLNIPFTNGLDRVRLKNFLAKRRLASFLYSFRHLHAFNLLGKSAICLKARQMKGETNLSCPFPSALHTLLCFNYGWPGYQYKNQSCFRTFCVMVRVPEEEQME